MTSRPAADPLYMTDAEIAARIPLGPDEWAAAARVLERDGLPPCDPLFGGRRCWPRVRDFLYTRAGGTIPAGAEAGKPGERQVENLDVFRSAGRRGART